ncbi:malonyl-CoA-[acp] transacylase [Campylobacter sp. RM5004]|uniref:ACP S-malonyltransferase n=1 Tax=Campylobacter sp. RM5004 TaxID=1660078 RepID=UPI001EFB2FA6|nr:ACP S-malonyltransferase [Campylobacter sp. RM5004]ULO01048.1 malonyl-CoA-[acp] transacylase [Campylobacter sp. RM5004]
MNYAFIYPGQGSQSAFMGKDLYDNFEFVRKTYDEVSEFCDIDFKELIFSENERLNISEFTQPAILLNSMMYYKVFEKLLDENKISLRESNHTAFLSKKNTPSLGHSLGEFSALCANKAIDLKNALKLVNMRGKFMQECASSENPASMMVILGLNDSDVEMICNKANAENKQIYAANYNCDGQIVVAGIKKDLEESAELFKSAGAKRAMMLNMSVASHCPLMQNAANKLEEFLVFNDNFTPVISNATKLAYNTQNEAKQAIKEQLIKPVLYKQSILELESSVDGFIEFGSNVLCGLNKKITQKESVSIKSLDDINNFIKAIKEKL